MAGEGPFTRNLNLLDLEHPHRTGISRDLENPFLQEQILKENKPYFWLKLRTLWLK